MYYRTEISNNGYKYVVKIYHYRYTFGLYPHSEYLKTTDHFVSLIDVYKYISDYLNVLNKGKIEYVNKNHETVTPYEFIENGLYSDIVKGDY